MVTHGDDRASWRVRKELRCALLGLNDRDTSFSSRSLDARKTNLVPFMRPHDMRKTSCVPVATPPALTPNGRIGRYR